MKDYFKGGLDPSVALKSSYIKIVDNVNSDNEKEEIRIFLVVTVAAPFIF
jgi:uracil phosphoribosyltransferase